MSPATQPALSDTCGYCGGRLPVSGQRSGRALNSAAYCCYGCRVLGESGQRPLSQETFAMTPWFRVALGAAIAGQTMLISLATNLSAPVGTARDILHLVLIGSTFGVGLVLGKPLIESAWEGVRGRRLTFELLFLAGILGAFVSSAISTLRGQGPVYYETVAVLLTVYAAGKTLNAQSRARALAEADRVYEQFNSCRVLRGDSYVEVPAAEVKVGDCVQVLAGESICVDGRVQTGEALVTETPLTGEPFPAVRRAGDDVLAGSFCEDGPLMIQARVNGGSRRLDGLLSELALARGETSRLQAQADKVVSWFLPVVGVLSAGTFGYWSWVAGWSTGLFNAMAVLLVACPCAMGLATPIAVWNALAALASRGLVPRNADIIERLAEVDSVFLDKTGTVSEERSYLVDLVTAGDPEFRRELVAMIVAVEARCSHPVARAFGTLSARCTAVAPKLFAESPGHGNEGTPFLVERSSPINELGPNEVRVRAVKTLPARGVEAWVELPGDREHRLSIGTREMVQKTGAEPELLGRLRHDSGERLVYIQLDGELAGIAAIKEKVRESAVGMVSQLEALGLDWRLITGDQRERALLMGFERAEGSLTPEQKAARVRDAQAGGHKVLFVGDGLNDALALRAANAGIALQHGAGLAAVHADAILYGSGLEQIPWALAFSRHIRDALRSNLLFAAVYNVLGLSLAAAGWLHPVASALLMVSSSGIVSWRAVQATRRGQTCCVSAKPDKVIRAAAVAALPTSPPGGWRAPEHGLLLMAQGPFIAYLGSFSLAWSAATTAFTVLAGLGFLRFRTRNLELWRYASMTMAMVGLGNWGMLLGWWADSGFQAVGPVSCCHCTQSNLWMYLGMVVFGVPAMVRGTGKMWSKIFLGGLSSVGMVLGMAGGCRLASSITAASGLNGFATALACMTLGMLAGMFFLCELGWVVLNLLSATTGREFSPETKGAA